MAKFMLDIYIYPYLMMLKNLPSSNQTVIFFIYLFVYQGVISLVILTFLALKKYATTKTKEALKNNTNFEEFSNLWSVSNILGYIACFVWLWVVSFGFLFLFLTNSTKEVVKDNEQQTYFYNPHDVDLNYVELSQNKTVVKANENVSYKQVEKFIKNPEQITLSNAKWQNYEVENSIVDIDYPDKESGNNKEQLKYTLKEVKFVTIQRTLEIFGREVNYETEGIKISFNAQERKDKKANI